MFLYVACMLAQWSSPKPPKPDPDSPRSDLQRRGTTNGLMSGHQQSLNHHQHHSQQQQSAATSSSSRLGIIAAADPTYQQQVPAVDAAQYPRAMCAVYNGGSTPTAAHQGYSPVSFSASRGSNVSATPGHAALGGPSAASYCMPMGSSAYYYK